MSHLRLRLATASSRCSRSPARATRSPPATSSSARSTAAAATPARRLKHDFSRAAQPHELLRSRTSRAVGQSRRLRVETGINGDIGGQRSDRSGRLRPRTATLAAGEYFVVLRATPRQRPELRLAMPRADTMALIQNGAAGRAAAPTCRTTTVDVVGYGGNTTGNFEGPVRPRRRATRRPCGPSRCANGCTRHRPERRRLLAPALPPRATRPRRCVCGAPPPNQPVTVTCGGGLTTLEGDGRDAERHCDRPGRHRHGLQRRSSRLPRQGSRSRARRRPAPPAAPRRRPSPSPRLSRPARTRCR